MLVRSRVLSVVGIGLCFLILAASIYTIYIAVYNSDSNDSPVRRLHIRCNENRTGAFGEVETIYFNFTNIANQTITFTNCGSGSGVNMYLKNSSENYIQSQSTNECDGRHCYDPMYCTAEYAETFTMEALPPGTYTIELISSYSSTDFNLEVICHANDSLSLDYQYNIQCGETITGNLDYSNSASFNFTNPQQQEVVITDCGSNIQYTEDLSQYNIKNKFSIKNSSGLFYENGAILNSSADDLWCDYALSTETLVIDTLSSGQYTIDFSPEYHSIYGGEGTFAVTVICPEWNTFNIECGQTVTGNVSDGDTVYFRFQSDEQQDVTLSACNSSFVSDLELRDSEGNVVDDSSTSNATSICTLNAEALLIGQYTLEMSPKDGTGTFSVGAVCNTTMNVSGVIGCDEVAYRQISKGGTALFRFNNTKKQNVLFTDCGARNEWPSMDLSRYSLSLRNSSGTYIQSKSTNQCDGSDCFFADPYCNNTNAETFLMLDLPEDIYIIEITHLWNSESADDISSIRTICDPIPCNEYQDLSIESGSYFAYQCSHYVDGLDSLNHQFCLGDSGITETDVEQIIDIYELVDNLGLGLQNNILLLSLLFINVSTAIFIMIGLNRISLNIDIRTITNVIVLTQLLLITSFLSFNHYQFGQCSMQIAETQVKMPTVFHLFIYTTTAVICYFLARFACHSCLCGCRYIICVLAFILLWSADAFQRANDVAVLPNILIGGLFVLLQALIPVSLCNLTPRGTACFEPKICRHGILLLFLSLLSAFCAFAVAVSGMNPFHTSFSTICQLFGETSWLNPLFVISTLNLLFSNFRTLALFQNFILLIIFLSQYLSDSFYFCSAVVNVQYIIHSFCIPLYIFLLFRSVPQLRPFSTSLVGLYLCAFDVWSDFVVIVFFIRESEYIFASIQILVVVTGQVVGAISDVFASQNEALSNADKAMAALGFGRIWFTVNWWNEKVTTEDDNGIYKVLRQKHEIWDLLYESFPTVALQLYASMTTSVPLVALFSSISVSAVTVSFSIVLYLGALLRVQKEGDDKQTSLGESGQRVSSTTASPMISSPKRDPRRQQEKSLYLILFAFMVTDFYTRSIPMMMIFAIICNKWFGGEGTSDYLWRFMIGSLIFGATAIFEFIANYQIRVDSHRGLAYILKVFAASIFSSFHTILCTLSVLKMDPFYAKSVIFSKYLVEHGIRCVFAVFYCILSIVLGDVHLLYPFVLSALLVFCLVINGVTIHWISRSEFISAVSRQIQQEQVIGDVQSIELQAMESIHSQSEKVKDTVDEVQSLSDDGALQADPVDTDTDLEIYDIYDMITDVLEEEDGPDPE